MRAPWSTVALVVVLCGAVIAACSSAGGTGLGSGGGGGGSGAGLGGSDAGSGGSDASGGVSGNMAGSGDAGSGGEGGASSGGAGGGPGGGAGGSPGGAGGTASGGAGSSAGGDPLGGGGSGPLQLLAIAPVDAVFTPPAGTGLSAKYKALLKETGKPTVDVTAEAIFSVEPGDFGSFVGSTLQAPAGKLGQATIKCSAKGLNTSTKVTIEQGKVVIGPGAPGDAPGKFSGPADPNAPVEVVYPPSGILVPPNMNSLEIHFIPAAGQQLFELKFTSSTVSYTVYTGCTPLNGGCVFTPDASFWQQMANGARGNAPVSYTVRGVDGAGNVGTSAARTVQFAADDLEGGIYYWNAQGLIMRYDFGYPKQPAEVYMNAFEAQGFTCVGCHTISRNGKRIAVGVDIPAPAPYRVFNVGSKSLVYPPPSYGANFFAFNPDATQMLISDGNKISWIDANTGALLQDAVVPSGTMPDWSPDGSALVYARPKTPPPLGVAAPGVDSASLEVRSFGGAGFGPPTVLVPFNGANNYYPSYSPDGAWVAFNRSPGNKNSFENASNGDGGLPDGEVWAVAAQGGTPIRLDNATQPGDSWPKWAVQTSTYEGGTVHWLTFSSWRAYGLRLPAFKTTQLWMVAFDPARAAKGQDPSFPAFWLPFQSLSSGNHIAQWVVKVERKPCSSPADCSAGQTCGPQSQCIPL
ncbi:MAG: hypothetical protein RMJ98_02970 [Myxococcales bacterium]|nr:hypothetical protein [Polyangiaceae bacterium]MDW8248252.1 hypothetical protein [Myxococcales bacterium]